MTLKETGRVLCIGQTKVFDLINQGHLRVIHIGRRTLVPVEAVEHLLRVGA
jgi:excisionase family DNA binding protein